MQIYGTIKLADFVQNHPSARAPFAAWQLEAEEATWTGPYDVRSRYLTAVVEPSRVVFNIQGMFRIGVVTRYERGVLLVENVWLVTVAPELRRAANGATMRSRA